MTGQEIINNFRVYVDDSTQLSSSEELALLNKIYYQILDLRPYEFLKKEWSTTTNGTDNITLPTDFKYFTENQDYTDNSTQTEEGKAPKAVFIGNSPYKLINWSDRRQYANAGGYCYVDVRNGKLYFTSAPSSGLTLSADYIYVPTALTLATEPVFPESYQHAIYHGMAIDEMIIELFDKARSYATENKAMYDGFVRALNYYNANLLNF